LNYRKTEPSSFVKRHRSQNLPAAVGRQTNIPLAAGAHGIEPPRVQVHWHIMRSAKIGVVGHGREGRGLPEKRQACRLGMASLFWSQVF
jgi:hypothetical protein